MILSRAVLPFALSFALFAGLGHALPGLPRLAGETWRAMAHSQGPAMMEDGTEGIALYSDAFGHFQVDARIDGTQIAFMVDSGASYVGLTGEDAVRLGIDPAPDDFTLEVGTANGALKLAPIVIPEIAIGHVVLKDVPATVSPRGTLHESLLGMTALSRFGRVEFSGRRMTLVP